MRKMENSKPADPRTTFDPVINRVVFTDAEMKRQRQELRENWKILQAWAEKNGKKIDLRHM
jgi:hypothetical protein